MDLLAREENDADDWALNRAAIYGLECALTALWKSVGVEPAADYLRLARSVGGEVALVADAVERVAQAEHIDYLCRAGKKCAYAHGFSPVFRFMCPLAGFPLSRE